MRGVPAALISLSFLAQAASASTIFVTNEKDNTVSVLDSEMMKLVKTIPVGKRPRGIVITPDFTEVLVCAGDDNKLDVIDTAKLEVVRRMDTGPDPELLDIDHKRTRGCLAR